MTNSITIAAPRPRVWDALNDPATLRRCIAGCESIEATGDNAYKVAMTVAIGPVKAKFKGELMLEDIDAPNGYTIRFSGQGGVAGFGKGSARVTLSAEDEGTRLDYTVAAQVGGKIAQIGSRLVEGASKKMADDFFRAFLREVEAPVPTPVPTPVPVLASDDTPPSQVADSSIAAVPVDPALTSRAGVDPVPTLHVGVDPVPTSHEAVEHLMVQALSNERWTWLAIAVAVAATGLLLVKR